MGHCRFAQAIVKMGNAEVWGVAALSERPAQGNSTAGGRWCTTEPPDVSLRGGRRPTWQSCSTRLNRGKAIGKNAAAFPRLPRPLWGLAMTNLEALRGRRCHPITCQPARRAGSAATDAIGLCVFAGSLYELQVPAVFRLRILPPVRQRMRNRQNYGKFLCFFIMACYNESAE